ncbi:hypothetical protein EVAR_83970_1 [Eumeta japonica]|uniref:Uncharacterized protein n=1 Tax=Eumeta variegata TaxID=151549 RepID=A0A4C1VP14_EUMVA|nr:hypothetical protein EVAR_83970_1 [Eumeta japonica]
MDITVWMSSPNDEVPAVAEAGSDTEWLAADGFSGRSRAALSGSDGLWFTQGWRRGEAAAGGLLAAAWPLHLAAVALPWTSFLVRGLYSDTERPHHVQIIEYVLGFLRSWEGRRELAIMVSRLCGKVCTECRGSLAAEVGLDFVYRESVGMPRITAFSLRSSSRAYV